MNTPIRTAVFSLALLLAACGGGGGGGGGDAGAPAPVTPGGPTAPADPDEPPAVATGTVSFGLGARSCNGSRRLDFVLGNRIVGSATLWPGQSSPAYPTSAGTVVYGASATDVSGRNVGVWAGRVEVPAAGAASVVLECTVKR